MTAQEDDNIRDQLRHLVEHLAHVLPGQAPLDDFVHHNTLHGYQQRPFRRALAEAAARTGARGYVSQERMRGYYASGRITSADLESALEEEASLGADEEICRCGERALTRRDIYLAALLYPLPAVTACQLNWQMEEQEALRRCQRDLPADSRQRLLRQSRLEGADGEAQAVNRLWSACLEVLGLDHYIVHPEELAELSSQEGERMLDEVADVVEEEGARGGTGRLLRKEAAATLGTLLQQVGSDLTLRGLLLSLTGRDLLNDVRPPLLRFLSNYLDQGLAAWHGGDRSLGFYRVWRHHAQRDKGWIMEDLPHWRSHLESLPDDPLEAIIAELSRMGVKQNKWADYLECLALELPGWSGMVLWRDAHPGYSGSSAPAVTMLDYLAVRLVLEHSYAQRICSELWRIEASFDILRWYLRRNSAEFLVRHYLFNRRLPEYIVSLAQKLVTANQTGVSRQDWWRIATLIHIWRSSPAGDAEGGFSVYRSGWPLFRLCQRLGLSAGQLRAMGTPAAQEIFATLARLTPEQGDWLWLRAFENHYRDQLFAALQANVRQGQASAPPARAQLVFCMDDREEGLRRHLEELADDLETFGAAAHYNVFNYWLGLDETQPQTLCPVGARPVNLVREQVRKESAPLLERHRKGKRMRARLASLLYQDTRRDLLRPLPVAALMAPLTLIMLLGRVFAPLTYARIQQRLVDWQGARPSTRIALTAEGDPPLGSPEQPRKGFSLGEQLDRCEVFLRNMGLTKGFAPLVVIAGHGSSSQNNPHSAAYDCGACSGRHSGPNARILCAMLNRPEVRGGLAERGIEIPLGSWFLAAEHNTCTDGLEWFDRSDIPAHLEAPFEQLLGDLQEAARRHAHERCRRFASAPRRPSKQRASRHVRQREADFSQPRPELGHAGNASAVIGRRSLTQGMFLDRRMFLISYDPTQDPEGLILERLLLANGPVGAGISLEYYFSAADNDYYGCGSKVTHNVTGRFGVMDGATSDLRTGLPRQMIEIHEPMRLQLMVDASREMVEMIYQRQAALQELVGNGWLLLSLLDAHTGEILTFDPSAGFSPWHSHGESVPRLACSQDWYQGQMQPLPAALIRRNADAGVTA